MRVVLLFVVSLNLFVKGLCNGGGEDGLDLTYETAQGLASLPLECYNKYYPFKFSQVWQNASDVAEHTSYIPIFAGCFDWHSSVHGHWLLATLLNRYPQTELAEQIISVFDEQFKDEKVAKEVAWFKRDKHYERTYGWSWFLKLHHELKKSPLDTSHRWSNILQPLADHLVQSYITFLPNLVYPIRVGEHSNTAFGLIFPLEYAQEFGRQDLDELIKHNSSVLYTEDKNCPLSFEPSGYDFLSPCLQEASLMGQVIGDSGQFDLWLRDFLPSIFREDFELVPGEVIDRTDGKLVHLDGLNFSRAWSIYSIILGLGEAATENVRSNLMRIGDAHILQSMDFVVGSDYAGSHWLASFLTHALLMREKVTSES